MNRLANGPRRAFATSIFDDQEDVFENFRVIVVKPTNGRMRRSHGFLGDSRSATVTLSHNKLP